MAVASYDIVLYRQHGGRYVHIFAWSQCLGLFSKMSVNASILYKNQKKHVVAERSSALNVSSGVVRTWVRIPTWPVAALVSLSKTLNHNCFVLRMGRKTVGPVCCVMHVKEPRTLIVKEKGLSAVFLDLRLEHPAGWICVCYKSSVLLLLLLLSL